MTIKKLPCWLCVCSLPRTRPPPKKRSHFMRSEASVAIEIAACTNRTGHWSFLWIEPEKQRSQVGPLSSRPDGALRENETRGDNFICQSSSVPIAYLCYAGKRARGRLRGAWTDCDTNDIFAHCSRIFYFLDFKFSNFVCLSELHPLIWFFFLNSFRKKKNIQKITQNALAPSIFILLSIVLKLGTPLLHTQAQNTLLQNF